MESAGVLPPEAKNQSAALANAPRITRLLVLGRHFERLVRDGIVKNYAEIAWLTSLSRARVTQIVNLILLPPRLQEEALALQVPAGGYDSVIEP